MSMVGKTNRQKSSYQIVEKIGRLVGSSEELTSISDIHYPGHAWSIVKLLLLGGWVYVYTTIIPKWFDSYQYVDLLAGSGTMCVEETQDVVVGSAFIPHFLAHHPFTSYVYVEKRKDRYDALCQRATKLLGEKAQVLRGDCNELARSILTEEKRVHRLVFIDNEGFDAAWTTMEALMETNTDIILLFPTASVSRVASSERTWSSLDTFYNGPTWKEANDEQGFLEIYLQQLQEEFKNLRKKEAYISTVRVGTGQFYYDIALLCKKGPYVRAWEYLKKRLDWRDPRTIKTALDVLKGRATQIDWFTDLQEQVASIKRGKRPERQKKTTLDSFWSEKQKGRLRH